MHNKWSIVPAAAALMATLLAATAEAQPAPPVERYQVVHGWPELPPGEILGQATGVDVDSKGNVWVFHRAGREWSEPFPIEPIDRPTVWVFDGQTGRLLTSWGANTFVMPHGLTIDHDDNVWLTDVGRHQVFKFGPDGRQLLVLGEARVPGDDARHFNQPTDVAVAANGTFFVSDGYGNSRVLHFTADGKLLMVPCTWWTPGASGCRSSCRDEDVGRGDGCPVTGGLAAAGSRADGSWGRWRSQLARRWRASQGFGRLRPRFGIGAFAAARRGRR